MGFAHCSETWLDLPHLPENLENGPNIGNMQRFRNATSGRLSLLVMRLNNCERKLPFPTVSYEVIAGYKCSSEFTFETRKTVFCQQFLKFSFDDHVNSTNETWYYHRPLVENWARLKQ